MNTTVSLNSLKERLKGREIYLRGARQLGFSTARTLRREGFEPTAFLDASPDLIGGRSAGLPVLAPGAIDGKTPGSFFIIITSGFFYTEIAAEYRAAGLVEGRDFIIGTELQAFDYMVDVSGSCNLRCISCPRGNFRPQPSAGFMTAETYDKILEKIIREDPFVGAVALYQWGEPLLNKDLPEMIRMSTARGVQTAISSNLNYAKNLAEVVKAGPAWFRVSTSGWAEHYEETHRGGKWPVFLENLEKLRDLAAEYAPEMTIEVFYHIYKDRQDDYRKMKAHCDALGLPLRIRHAALAPLDTVDDLINGRPLSPEAEETRGLQYLKVEEAMRRAYDQRDLPCPYARYLWITWDGYMHLCMEWFDNSSRLEKKFLDTPLAEILSEKANDRNTRFCRNCMDQGIHRCYVVYGDESLIEPEINL